jgi:hypothetical protein
MKNLLYWLGKGFQVSALVILPFAIWAGQIRRSEKEAISIFLISVLVFLAGSLLTGHSQKL